MVQLSAAELLVALLAAADGGTALSSLLDGTMAGGMLSSLLRLEQSKAGLPAMHIAAAGIAWLAELPELRATIAEQPAVAVGAGVAEEGSSPVFVLRQKCIECIAQATAAAAARAGPAAGPDHPALYLHCDGGGGGCWPKVWSDSSGRSDAVVTPLTGVRVFVSWAEQAADGWPCALFASGWVAGGCEWSVAAGTAGGPRQCPDFRLNPQLRLAASPFSAIRCRFTDFHCLFSAFHRRFTSFATCHHGSAAAAGGQADRSHHRPRSRPEPGCRRRRRRRRQWCEGRDLRRAAGRFLYYCLCTAFQCLSPRLGCLQVYMAPGGDMAETQRLEPGGTCWAGGGSSGHVLQVLII